MQHLIFYAFAALLIISSLMVVCSRNPVRVALFLVLAFVAASPLWLMLEAEFLALVLVFVYVGAVMTLFLFVVMMLNLEDAPQREGFVRYLPFGLLVMALMVGIMAYVLLPSHFASFQPAGWLMHNSDYSNTKAIGQVLYTDYAYAFEIAALLLLVAIVAAISLAFRGSRKRKQQAPGEQVQVKAEQRLRMMRMPAEEKQ